MATTTTAHSSAPTSTHPTTTHSTPTSSPSPSSAPSSTPSSAPSTSSSSSTHGTQGGLDNKLTVPSSVSQWTEPKQPDEVFASVRMSRFDQYVRAQSQLIENAFDHFDIEIEVLQQMLQTEREQKKLYVVPPKVVKNNRYTNIVPIAATRVHLSILNNDSTTDYINANHIPAGLLEGSTTAYIAASAPVLITCDDWWRMIWEQKTTVIVMLTRLMEKDRKASQYWPDSKAQSYGRIKVTPVGEPAKNEDPIIRKFKISNDDGKTEREVVHIQYIGWPDQGVPVDYASFVHLFERYREFRDSPRYQQGGPVLLHCSAGIGRTGTLCALDILLDYLNKNRLSRAGVTDPLINVFSLVKALRDHRAGMVQSKAQYHFVSLFLNYCIQNHLLGI